METIQSNDKKVTAFLQLPNEALPSISYVDEDGAWVHYPSDALRDAHKTGTSCESACGSKIRIRADRDGWRDGFIVA